ncbi:MAG: hypothetical protein AAFV19_05060 [Pseudomonadota bacterium]
MTKTCFVHIGMMKAGSSSIQHYMFDNRAFWRDTHGISYWDAAANHGIVATALSPDEAFGYRRAGLMLRRQRDAFRAETLDAFRTALAAHTSGPFVLSGEAFCDTTPETVEAFREIIAPVFDVVKVVLYAREPYAFANSLCQQRFKSGTTFDQVIHDTLVDPKYGRDHIDRNTASLIPKYRWYMEKFIAAFGAENIIVRDFSRNALRHGDAVADFVHVITGKDMVELGAPAPGRLRNASLDHHLAWLLEGANHHLPPFHCNADGAPTALNFDRPPLLPMILEDTARAAQFHLKGFDFERFADVVRPETDWLAEFTNGAVDFRGVRPEPVPEADSDDTAAVGELIVDLVQKFSHQWVETQKYRCLFELSRGRAVDPDAMSIVLKQSRDPGSVLGFARGLRNLGAPELALQTAERALDLAEMGGQSDMIDEMHTLISSLEAQLSKAPPTKTG